MSTFPCRATISLSVPDPCAIHPSAAEANEALRAFVRAHGRRAWSRAELAELDRLRQVWREAVRDGDPVVEMVVAA